ncbi:MAG: universal stress protein, partial [Burkholderiales bacterium]
MLKILVPVDGSPSSERALKRLIHMLEIGAPAEVHLVHAQPNIDPAKLRSIAQPGLLERLQREEEEQ